MGRILAGVSKLVLGVALALLMMSMAGVATARYFMARLSVLPPRPEFNNDTATANNVPTDTNNVPTDLPIEAAQPAEAPATPVELPNDITIDGYQAVVVQPIGLVLRSGPGTDHSQIGGLDYDTEVTVLEDDPTQGWIRIRVTGNGQEGWVKSGNTRRL